MVVSRGAADGIRTRHDLALPIKAAPINETNEHALRRATGRAHSHRSRSPRHFAAGFLSASMQLHVAARQLPADSPAKPRVTRVLELMGQVIEEGRTTLKGLRSTDSSSRDLVRSEERRVGKECRSRW